MGISQHLGQKQSQSLVLSQRLQQSLKLLQYSTQELQEFVNQELQENPFLQLQESEAENSSDNIDNNGRSPNESTSDGHSHGEEQKDVFENTKENNFPSESGGDLDISHENNWDKEENSAGESTIGRSGKIQETGKSNYSGNDLTSIFEQTISEEKTLNEHIMEQVLVDITDPRDRIIALHLIDMLDEAGYIPENISPLKKALNCTAKDIDRVVCSLQQCDPPGIFARSLSECLALQLRDKNRLDPSIAKLLKNLELVASGDVRRLQRILNVSAEEIKEMLQEIRQLDPKPGSNFTSDRVQVVVPDVFVRRAKSGNWFVELNSDVLPKLLVDRSYYAEIKEKTKGRGDKKFLSEQMSAANWLVKTLHQRAETILRISTELVREQSSFFEKGIHYLKPLTLAALSEKLDLHESTVGRVTANKYIATPRGIYDMRYFFSSAVGSGKSGAGNFSSNSVKYLIKDLVDNEKSHQVLSDDKIVQKLKGKGINVARRTVAKYREAMNIPSSAERRKIKKSIN